MTFAANDVNSDLEHGSLPGGDGALQPIASDHRYVVLATRREHLCGWAVVAHGGAVPMDAVTGRYRFGAGPGGNIA